MSDSTDQLHTTLRSSGYSFTATRRLVFKQLSTHGPMSMSELIKACGAQADRASVYRSISLFESLGIIQRLQSGWKYRIELGDAFQPHHHHMYCTQCLRTFELPEDHILEKQLHSLAIDRGFKPVDHQLEIKGICSDCQTA